MKSICSVMHEWANVKGKMAIFKSHKSHFWGSVKKKFGEFCFWCVFKCCCCFIIHRLTIPHLSRYFSLFSWLSEHNFRETFAIGLAHLKLQTHPLYWKNLHQILLSTCINPCCVYIRGNHRVMVEWAHFKWLLWLLKIAIFAFNVC